MSKYIKHQRSSDDEYVKLFLYLSKYVKPAEFHFAEKLYWELNYVILSKLQHWSGMGKIAFDVISFDVDEYYN